MNRQVTSSDYLLYAPSSSACFLQATFSPDLSALFWIQIQLILYQEHRTVQVLLYRSSVIEIYYSTASFYYHQVFMLFCLLSLHKDVQDYQLQSINCQVKFLLMNHQKTPFLILILRSIFSTLSLSTAYECILIKLDFAVLNLKPKMLSSLFLYYW